MISPEPQDPAGIVVETFIDKLRQCFNPNDINLPPLGGGSTEVHFLVADDPMAYIDDALQTCKRSPFLWVRLHDRYRTRLAEFPNPVRGNATCNSDLVDAVTIEIGIARCSSKDATIDWNKAGREAEISMSDSWRIQTAMNGAGKALRCGSDRAFSPDTVAVYGPEGGIVAWTCLAYVQLTKD